MNFLKGTEFKDGLDFIGKVRNVIYILIGIPLIVFVILYLNLIRNKVYEGLLSEEFTLVVKIVFTLLIIGDVIYAYVLFNKKLKGARAKDDLKIKLEKYYHAVVLKFSIMEAAVLLSLIGLLLTADNLFTGIFVAFVFIYSINSPNIYKVMRELRLDKESRKSMLEKDHFLSDQ